MNFRTSEYEFSHGHAPRGRGGWVFEFPHGAAVTEEAMAAMRASDGVSRVEVVPGVRPVVQVWMRSMTYGDARVRVARAVRAAFPQGFYADVVVGS